MATQVITNHHHVTFSGSSQALPHHLSSPPGPTTSYSVNGGFASFNSSAHNSTSVEHDNPFRPGSELIEEAESILKSVTIVGSQVLISGSNDSGIGALSPNQERSPAVNASAANETHLQCSTILASPVHSSPPAHGSGQLNVSEDRQACIVQRASPESLRPESPPMRAEHVVVTSSGVKVSPKPEPAEPSNPFNDPKLKEDSQYDVKDNDDGKKKSKKDKKKKKCSIL